MGDPPSPDGELAEVLEGVSAVGVAGACSLIPMEVSFPSPIEFAEELSSLFALIASIFDCIFEDILNPDPLAPLEREPCLP